MPINIRRNALRLLRPTQAESQKHFTTILRLQYRYPMPRQIDAHRRTAGAVFDGEDARGPE